MLDFSEKCYKYKMFKLVRKSIDIINILYKINGKGDFEVVNFFV